MTQKRGLGRGLGALIPGGSTPSADEQPLRTRNHPRTSAEPGEPGASSRPVDMFFSGEPTEDQGEERPRAARADLAGAMARDARERRASSRGARSGRGRSSAAERTVDPSAEESSRTAAEESSRTAPSTGSSDTSTKSASTSAPKSSKSSRTSNAPKSSEAAKPSSSSKSSSTPKSTSSGAKSAPSTAGTATSTTTAGATPKGSAPQRSRAEGSGAKAPASKTSAAKTAAPKSTSAKSTRSTTSSSKTVAPAAAPVEAPVEEPASTSPSDAATPQDAESSAAPAAESQAPAPEQSAADEHLSDEQQDPAAHAEPADAEAPDAEAADAEAAQNEVAQDERGQAGEDSPVVDVEPGHRFPAHEPSAGAEDPEPEDVEQSQDGSTDTAPSAGELMPVPGAEFAEIPIHEIRENPRNPRNDFDDDELDELAFSLREVGVLQPVVVRPIPVTDDGESFELVMGERRWRAARRAGLGTIPAIIRQTSDDDLLRDALLENLHRSQLNPLEEAAAYQQLLEDFGCTQDELADRIGRSRPQISNTLRLMRLPALVQRRLASGALSAGHARALISVEDPRLQEELAQRIVAEGLSVRETERLVSKGTEPATTRTPPRRTSYNPRVVDLTSRLSNRLEAPVKIDVGKRKGRITLEFTNLDDLERLAERIGLQLEGGFSEEE